MTNKMTLIVAKKTGHVLGVVTRESDPEGRLEPADVAGEELLVRLVGDPTAATFNAQFLVPANELAVEVKDFDQVVVTRPREFCLNAEKQVIGTAGTPTANNPAPTPNTQIRVGAAAAVAVKTPVWIQVSSSIDPTNTQVRQGEIDVGQTEVDLDVLPLDSGDHYVLALVGGHALLVEEITV
jgi:hypothetical protein